MVYIYSYPLVCIIIKIYKLAINNHDYIHIKYIILQIQRNDEHTTLTVDGVSQIRTSRGKEFHFGKFATNSDVFVGGMPNW